MFRFVALFALVAVAFAEPEADPQYFYHHLGVPVVRPVVPVVKAQVPVVKPVVPFLQYVDPHHTEGMTKDGVPEKTDSVKIAEKQHEIAQIYENSKKAVLPYAFPSAYTGYYPYVHSYVPNVHSYVPTVGHVVAKREAEGESDPYVVYNNQLAYTGAVSGYPYTGAVTTGAVNNQLAYTGAVTGYPYTAGVTGYPYTAAVTGYPYTSAVAGYPYTHATGYPYTTAVNGYHYQPVVHSIAKREADSDAQYFYRGYTPYASNYNYGTYNYGTYPYTHRYRNAWYY